jgi:homospermidine synthase
MKPDIKHAAFQGTVVMVGFGCMGQAMLPLLFRHLEIQPGQVKIISRSEDKTGIAREFGVRP